MREEGEGEGEGDGEVQGGIGRGVCRIYHLMYSNAKYLKRLLIMLRHTPTLPSTYNSCSGLT